jgi:hypothetical protein
MVGCPIYGWPLVGPPIHGFPTFLLLSFSAFRSDISLPLIEIISAVALTPTYNDLPNISVRFRNSSGRRAPIFNNITHFFTYLLYPLCFYL